MKIEELKRSCKDIISLTMIETKARAKKDIKEAVHEGRVMDGVKKRYAKGGWE